jgi:hypothetical protein
VTTTSVQTADTATMSTVAYDYPLLDVFWSMLLVFLFIAWCMAVFGMLADVFRSSDLTGAAKAGWVLIVVLLPLIGVLLYLIVRGDHLTQHARSTVDRQDAAYLSYAQRGR